MISKLRSRGVGHVLLIGLVVLILLLPGLVQPSKLVYPTWSEFSDLTLIHWPKVSLIRESLSEGHGFPLWSNYALSGQPLAANQLAMLFYPPALLLLVGPMAWAFSLFYVLHLSWAGIGTYWLVRGLGRTRESAVLAGLMFAIGGKLVAHTAGGHASLMAAMAWAPWALGFLHRLLTEKRLSYAIWVGVALAAQATTHTYALLFTSYGLLVYTLVYLSLASGPIRERLRASASLVPVLVLIPLVLILLGAAQILPLLEMAPYSNRALDLAEATQFSLSPIQTLTGLLIPTADVGHESIIYPGLFTLALAAGAWRARHERPVLIIGLLTATGVLLALGNSTPVYGWIYQLLPGVSWVRTPARLWFFVTLGLAVLTAYGFEAWCEVWRLPIRRVIRLVLVACIGFAALLSLGATFLLELRGRGVWGLGVFGVLTGALLLWAVRRRPPPAFAWLTLLLLAIDLLSFDFTMVRYVSQEQLAARGHSAAEWLAAQGNSFRVYSPSYSLPQPAVTRAGLQQIDGVEPVHLADYDRFMALAGGYDYSTFGVTVPPFPEGVPIEEAYRAAVPSLRLLGVLGGRYLAAAFPMDLTGLVLRWQKEGTWIYENELALPWAYVVHQTEVMPQEQMWERLRMLEPSQLALVEEAPVLSGIEGATPAEVTSYSPNRLVIEAKLDRPGLLVLSEIWYPGWKALDNGDETSIVRTNAVLRGVLLEPGHHVVELEYRPRTVSIGAAISAVTAVILSSILIVYGYRRWVL
jgi:hypothetical protein